MAVFKRKNKDGEEGETWYVDYRDPTGKRIIKAVGPSKREAEAFLGKIKGSIREGRFFDIKKEEFQIFKELSNWYLSLEDVKRKRSFERDRRSLAKLNGFFGPRLRSIRSGGLSLGR